MLRKDLRDGLSVRLSIVQPHGCARPQPRGWAAVAGGGSGAGNWAVEPHGCSPLRNGHLPNLHCPMEVQLLLSSLHPSNAGCELHWLLMYDLDCV